MPIDEFKALLLANKLKALEIPKRTQGQGYHFKEKLASKTAKKRFTGNQPRHKNIFK